MPLVLGPLAGISTGAAGTPSLATSTLGNFVFEGFWYRWLSGRWQEPQLVLLDHGLIVEIPDKLRQQYCQLWCSFVLNDKVMAKAVATQIAGVTTKR